MKHLLLLFLFLNVAVLSAQKANRDSLRQIIAMAGQDSIGIHATRDLAFDIAMFSPDSISYSIELTDEAIDLAKAKNIPIEEMKGYFDRAWMYYLQGDLANSQEDYLRAINLAEAQGQDYYYHVYRDRLAGVLFETGKKDEALALKYASIDYFKETNDTLQIVNSLGLLGHTYFLQDEYEKGKEIIYEKLSYNYVYPGTIEDYGNLGIAHYELGDLDSAVYYMELAGEMGKDYPFFMIANDMYLAKVLHKKGEKQKAITVLEAINEEYADLDEKNLYELKMLLSEYHLELGNTEESMAYFTEIESGLLSQDLFTQQKKSFLGSRLYEEKGDYEQALSYYKTYHEVTDTINEVSRDSAYQVIESKYQVAKKEEQIAAQKLKLKNVWLLLFSLAAVLLIALIGLYIHNRKQRYEKDLLAEKSKRQTLEIEGLQREKQLVSMQSILKVQEAERKRIARDLHDNIGSMMAAIKIRMHTIQENSMQLESMVNQVSEEVRRISHNMTPLAFGLSGLEGAVDDLCQILQAHDIRVEKDVQGLELLHDEDRAIMFFRILQEIINNIVKHSEATEVHLNSHADHADLHLSIRDNGKGVLEKEWAESQNLGFKNIKSRITYLQGDIAMKNAGGTLFNITIPIT